MNNEQRPVGDLLKDFTLVGTNRVHPWFAWAIVGIVFGMALGIVYVADRSGQFDIGKAFFGEPELPGMIDDQTESELRFVSPENNSEGDTNPVLVVESMYNGEPSLMPLEFSIARAGSDDFIPLAGSYNVGAYDPGIYVFVPSVFSNSLDPYTKSDEPAKMYAAVPAGEYTIRVTRASEPESEEFSAQVIKPILPIVKTPAKPMASINFSFGGTSPINMADRACGCENIKLEAKGPVDPFFKFPKGNPKSGNVKELGLDHELYSVNQFNSFESYIASQFYVQIKAALSPGSNPDYCDEGQKVQSSQFFDNTGEVFDLVQYTTAAPPSSQTFLEDIKPKTAMLNASGQQKLAGTQGVTSYINCKPGSEDWCYDDYSTQSWVKDHDTTSNPPIIKWFDGPGSRKIPLDKLPIRFDMNFTYNVWGNNEYGGISYFGDANKNDPYAGRYGWSEIYNWPQLPAGKSCTCKSHVTWNIDKDGKVIGAPSMTSDCDAATGGKDGKVEDSQLLKPSGVNPR